MKISKLFIRNQRLEVRTSVLEQNGRKLLSESVCLNVMPFNIN